MKKCLCLFVCVLMNFFSIHAQIVGEEVIGTTLQGKELKARSVEFDGIVREYRMDTTGTFFMMKIGYLSKNGKWFKNKGTLAVVDLPAGKELWRRKMNFRTDQFALLPGGVLFNSKGVKSFFLDLQTGQEKWNKKIFPYITDRLYMINYGSAYRANGRN